MLERGRRNQAVSETLSGAVTRAWAFVRSTSQKCEGPSTSQKCEGLSTSQKCEGLSTSQRFRCLHPLRDSCLGLRGVSVSCDAESIGVRGLNLSFLASHFGYPMKGLLQAATVQAGPGLIGQPDSERLR